MAVDSTPLDYASPPPGRSPWTARQILGLTAFLLAAAACAISSLTRTDRHTPAAPGAALYRTCAADAPPSSTVAYDDQIVSSAVAWNRPPGSLIINGWDSKPRRGRLPVDWFTLSRMVWPQPWPDDPVLFLHELRRPGRPPRLVLVHARLTWPGAQTVVGVDATVFAAGTLPSGGTECKGPVLTDTDRTTGTPLKIFAGQIDPLDPARFTIQYQLNGTAGTIGGKLVPGFNSSAGDSVVWQ